MTLRLSEKRSALTIQKHGAVIKGKNFIAAHAAHASNAKKLLTGLTRRNMYIVKKTLEIAASHRLRLDYESKCQEIHGHNWILEVTCQAEMLNQNGMVIDFTEIKRLIHDMLDHKDLTQVFDFNPTAENMAKWICDTVPYCIRVSVQESQGNIAIYEKI